MSHSGAVDRKTPRSRPIPWQYGLRELCLFVAAVGMALTVVLADLPWRLLDLFPFRFAACGLLTLSLYVGWIRKDCFTATWLALLAWNLTLLGVFWGVMEGFQSIAVAWTTPPSPWEPTIVGALFSELPLPLVFSLPVVYFILGCDGVLKSRVIRLLVVSMFVGLIDILLLLKYTLHIMTGWVHDGSFYSQW